MTGETLREDAPLGGATRRAFIGGAAALGAAQVVAGPLAATAAGDKTCEPDPPGIPTGAIAVTPDGRTVLTANTAWSSITAHRVRGLRRGRSLDVGGAPVDIAIAPDGGIALVTTAAYDRPGLAVVALDTRQVERLAVGPAPYGIAFAPKGRAAYVSGGGRAGTLTRVDLASGRVDTSIGLGAHPRGVAVTSDGKHALVALNGAAQIAVVDLKRGRVVRRIRTAAFPNHIAVSGDGERALVSHNGFGARSATLVELTGKRRRHKVAVGEDPSGVAFSASGRTAVVTSASGSVTVLDGRTGRRRRRIRRSGTPRSVAVAGSRAIVADGRSGRLAAIRLGVA